ncbi:hypothetical protein [Archaeoglobus profundus]|uniref:hypothetical protein n=1 Tax=Archaeoglobus profundus TaxID=84156 RepID=UPI00064F074E|nr:hypothetical protein [Archaeoglobus profundus]
MIKRRSEIAEERVLEILSKYPEGLGFNELYRLYKEREGENAVSNLTFSNVIRKLKEKGKIVIKEEGWTKGKKKTIKLKDAGKFIASKLSEIRAFKKAFDMFLENRVSRLKSELESLEPFEGLIILNEIEFGKSYIAHKLDLLRKEIISSELSEDFKKDLIFETFEVEKEIESDFINKIRRIEPLYDFYRAYLKTLQECIEEFKKDPLETIEKFETIFEKNLLQVNKELYKLFKHEQEERRKKIALRSKYTEEEHKKKLEELVRTIEENPEGFAKGFGEFLEDLFEFIHQAEEVGKLTEDVAIALDPYSSLERLKFFKSKIESEIESLIKEAKEEVIEK